MQWKQFPHQATVVRSSEQWRKLSLSPHLISNYKSNTLLREQGREGNTQGNPATALQCGLKPSLFSQWSLLWSFVQDFVFIRFVWLTSLWEQSQTELMQKRSRTKLRIRLHWLERLGFRYVDPDYFYPLQLLCNLDYHIREKKVGICFVFSGELKSSQESIVRAPRAKPRSSSSTKQLRVHALQ